MSININHPSEDISTSASEPPTLGGQAPLVADNATVSANSSGNVSRWVMSTASSTATYWAKIATFTSAGTETARLSKKLSFSLSSGGDTTPGLPHCIVEFYLADTVASGMTAYSLRVHSTNDAYFSHDSFMLVQAAATGGSPIELWAECNRSTSVASVVEESSAASGGAFTQLWNNGATWTATTPTGAVALTSDWSGSGKLTSTSVSNSTGTVYYEKSADGITTVNLVLTALTTTTDATAYFTMASGYRHGTSGLVLEAPLTATIAGGVAGTLRMSDVGVITIHNYAASTGDWRATFVYRARA